MALFGRESPAQQQRADTLRRWVQARTPYSLVAVGAGLLSVLDFFTPLGVVLGLLALGCGTAGLRQLARDPSLSGRRLCQAGMGLGVLGLTMSVAFMWWAY